MDFGTYSLFFYFSVCRADNGSANSKKSRGGNSSSSSESGQRIESCLNWVKGLTFEDLTFWAFGDSLANIKWRFSLREIRQYTQVKVSEKQADAITTFEALIKVLAMAFGGSKGKETKIQNESQLEAALAKMNK